MSWETFKQNILRVANSPEGIADINVVAESYAKEYDAAVKRGFDTQHKIPLVSGNVEMMKQLFISALQKGVNSPTPYDLVGEMGAGVKAYWAGATMATSPLPITPAIQATVNLSVTQNIVTNPGIWQQPTSSPIVDVSEELTPEKRIEYQERLEKQIEQYNQFIAEGKELVATTSLDAIKKFTAILEENKDYNTEVPVADAILGRVPGVPIPTTPTTPITTTTPTPTPTTPTPPVQNQTGLVTPPQSQEEIDKDFEQFLKESDEILIQGSGVTVSADNFSTGKPFVSGFKAGGGSGGGGSYSGAPYVPFNNFSGNATVGQKVVELALYDASQNVKEVGLDRGHPRIEAIQAFGNGKWGGGTGFAWCACTVTTWWAEAGFDVENVLKFSPNYKGQLSTTARHFYWPGVPQWTLWAIDSGRYVDMKAPENKNYIPKPGDAIIYDWPNDNDGASNHIGIFWKIDGGFWWGVDGNKSGGIKSHCIKNMACVQAIVRI
jgi:hypothetical protein